MISVTQNYFSVLELPIVRGRAFTEEEVSEPSRQRSEPASGHPERNDGAQPLAGRRPDRPDAAVRSPAHDRRRHPARRRRGRGCAGQRARTNRSLLRLRARRGERRCWSRAAPTWARRCSGIRAAVRAVDPTLLVTVLPLEATLGWSRGISGTVTTLFGGLGVLALVLASVGIYGVVSYAVAGRYREIGVRMALGATAWSVLGLVLRQTMRPVVVGAVIGVAAASAMSRILSSVLFGVSPADPIGLGGAALLVLGVAIAAGVMAARPATRADPTATLRHE